MGEFDSFNDSAFQLKSEGEKISLQMDQGVPSSNQATINWDIPVPALGCEGDGVYSGMVFLLHTSPLNSSNIPKDGKRYIADSTANQDIHSGDKIGDALVVGAFYECDKKGSEQQLTSSFIINDLKPDVGYYVAGYAVDCQNRYHSDGSRAYSDSYGNEDEQDFPAKQIINITKPDKDCILPTDATGLLPGAEYQFDIVIDNTFPQGTNFKVVEVNIDGINAGTYDELVDEINKNIALVGNPPTSPTAPNTGQFYWNATSQKLFLFDGINHNELPVLIEPTDPSIVNIGDYWFDPVTKILSRWNIPSPIGWNIIPYISTTYDPNSPTCNSYWLNNIIARKWNGTVWCDLPTILSTTDPVCCNIPPCGSWWYDEINLQLNEWNVTLNKWDERVALYWPEPPNQLSNGTYWFDSVNKILNVLTGGTTWMNISTQPNVFIQIVQPTTTVMGVLWYSPETELLKQHNGTVFVDLPIIVWPKDPSVIESCDAWWRSTDDNLLVWDAVGNAWVIVTNFTVSKTDPIFPVNLSVGQVWYNATDNVFNVWDGAAWITEKDFIISTTDPRTRVAGDSWFNPTSNEWKIWDVPNAGWNDINPLDVAGEPTLIPTGTYWFNSTNDALQIRNGTVWTSVMYSSSSLTPKIGDEWYNITSETLLEWDGTTYIPADVCAVADFENCGITITSAQLGSNTFVMIPVMTSPSCNASGFADFRLDGASPPRCGCSHGTDGNGNKTYPVRQLTLEASLWDATTPAKSVVLSPQPGNDGVSGKPSYDAIGVGDDGTPDERRELAHSIRAQLGYPVVEVELTAYQLDTAIQGAIESFRKRSSMAYRRGFYFLDVIPGQQNYVMTNKRIGYDKIVNVTAAYRFTSAFLSTAHGGGVYGQVVLQHLYNMGTYDLTSYHLVSQYIETMQDLFATRLVYNWIEQKRTLGFFQSFTSPERILLDCSIERTEQDLMTDRFAKSWVERYALSECMLILARIRGKYGSLPGAGGGVSLDAAELTATAELYRLDLMAQLDEYIVQDLEGLGMHSTFIFGG
jgi:hypothetical protein